MVGAIMMAPVWWVGGDDEAVNESNFGFIGGMTMMWLVAPRIF